MKNGERYRDTGQAPELAPFKELLLQACGHSFEKEREQALLAALRQRMAARAVAGQGIYHALLLDDPDELLRLTELLTVNETYFFREPDHLSLMVDMLLPEFTSCRNRNPVRILSAGCSTGEEPYSIAMLLRERYGTDSERLFAITGVDIDSTVIAAAQRGEYGKGSFRGMAPSLLERYFDQSGPGRFQIRDSIRKQVGFEVANLLGPVYPPGMQQPDIILYRNVSIYFPQQVQRTIFGKLGELLCDGGVLLVGASETFHHDVGILSLETRNSLFYFRKAPALVFEERRSASRCLPVLKRPGGNGAPTAARRGASPGMPGSPAAARQTPDKPRTRQLSPNRPDVRECFDAAVQRAHDRQPDKALALLDAILEQDQTFLKAYGLKGSLLLSLSRFDEAAAVCESLLCRDQLCLEAYLMLGMIARQNGKGADAVRRFREAIYLNASCWPAHFFTAEILFAQGDEKRARSSFEAAKRILDTGSLKEHGQTFFPLTFNAEQFLVICRHKLSMLRGN